MYYYLIYIYLDQNPVFTYNETVLNKEVERIMEEVGDPITVFLTSEEYKSVSCSVLAMDAGDDDSDDSDVNDSDDLDVDDSGDSDVDDSGDSDVDDSDDSDVDDKPGSSLGMMSSVHMFVIYLSLLFAL